MRALALAVGVTIAIIGLEFLLIERATITNRAARKSPPAATSPYGVAPGPTAPMMPMTRDFVPPEWAPWSLMATGAVIIIYSFTIPKRVAG